MKALKDWLQKQIIEGYRNLDIDDDDYMAQKSALNKLEGVMLYVQDRLNKDASFEIGDKVFYVKCYEKHRDSCIDLEMHLVEREIINVNRGSVDEYFLHDEEMSFICVPKSRLFISKLEAKEALMNVLRNFGEQHEN